MKELYIQVFGRVQGVNLRRRIDTLSNKLHLKGYVKNLDDGSVEMLVQGKEKELEELLSWVQKGYFPAKITGLRFEWRDQLTKQYKKFSIEKKGWFVKDEAKSLINLGKDLLNIDRTELNIPKHVVVIPDGNRRWAREKGWKAWIGHKKAVEHDRLKELIAISKEYGIKHLSFWAFSTENWSRDVEEIEKIFDLFRDVSSKWKEEFISEGIRFRHLGRKDRLPKDIMKIIAELEESTRSMDSLHFQLCFDYGGRDDLVRAINQMIKEGIQNVTEDMVSGYLDSKDIPDPDLIIRTSGEHRTSGIMPYESVYAELYFTNVYFPDFDSEQFKRALLDYSARTRRFGGTAVNDLANINTSTLVEPAI